MRDQARQVGRSTVAQDDDAATTHQQQPGKATLLDHHEPATAQDQHGHDPADAEGAADAAAAAGAQTHIITRAGLRHLMHAGKKGREAAMKLYNNPDAFVVLKEGQKMPHGFKAKATILFPSFHDFHAAHKAGRIGHDIKAVVYDNEHWPQTPAVEKNNAPHYAKLFGELCKKLHMTFVAAPTQKWFAADARYADVIDLQLQSREVNTHSYTKQVREDVNYAHAHNPGEKVVAQISSNQNHLDPSHTGNLGPGLHAAEGDILNNEKLGLSGFWGYLYQQNAPSEKAGVKMLEDLAAHDGDHKKHH
jgi:hypothetical protein